ncbi:MAG: shikimate dehydrogenase [Candidatus Goldbacteria bacterium]|nr:shikimate dehydrogenase [Candidatus Goldiibacteriota bacterium]
MKEKIITGIIGYPLSHTLSPLMHNSIFHKYKMNWEYKIFEIKPEDLPVFIKNMKKENIKGLNVTIPHKQTVMLLLDKIDKAAKTIGAVNTILNKNGILIGYNTDYLGFLKTLKEYKLNLKNKNVVMFGAGGAAHAVAYSINLMKPASFYIYNIDIPMIESLIKKLKLKNVIYDDITKTEEKDKILSNSDFIINTTSVGMHDNSIIYKLPNLKKGTVVYDLIYNPAKTEFLKQAEKKGAKIINGIDMLIYQGMESFKIWTGKKSDYKLIKKKLNEYFNKK